MVGYECSICQQNFELDPTIVHLGCSHKYHKVCIETYQSVGGSHASKMFRARNANWTPTSVPRGNRRSCAILSLTKRILLSLVRLRR